MLSADQGVQSSEIEMLLSDRRATHWLKSQRARQHNGGAKPYPNDAREKTKYLLEDAKFCPRDVGCPSTLPPPLQ